MSHTILFSVSILNFVLYRNNFIELIKDKPYAIYFLIYLTFVNLVWMAFYKDKEFVIKTLYYVFNIFVFFTFYISLKLKLINYKHILYFSLISLLVQYFLYLGIKADGSTHKYRETLCFNNPNQLSYYALLLVNMIFVVQNSFRKILDLQFCILIYIIATFLIILSNSKAVIVSLFVLALIVFIKMLFNKNRLIKFIALFSACALLFTLYANRSLVESSFAYKRFIKKEVDDSFAGRGYDRILNHKKYLLFGAGEGVTSRFNSELKNKELHSTLGNLLFSYGIIGLFLFMLILPRNIKEFFNFAVLISPSILYGLTHNGIRNPLFWMLIALTMYKINEDKMVEDATSLC